MSDFGPKRLNPSSQSGFWAESQREYARSMRICDSPDIRVQHSADGVMLLLRNQTGGGSVNLKRCKIDSISGDQNYILCHGVDEDGASTGEDFVILRPLNTRTYGNTRTINIPAVGTTPAMVQVQALDPPYAVDQFIIVGLDVDGLETGYDGIELSPPRQWVDDYVVVCATINGVKTTMRVRGAR